MVLNVVLLLQLFHDAVEILTKFVNLCLDFESILLVGKFLFQLVGMLFKEFMSK